MGIFDFSQWREAGWFGCGAVVGAMLCIGAVWALEDGSHGPAAEPPGTVVVRRDTVRRVDTVVVRGTVAQDSSVVGTVVRKLAVITGPGGRTAGNGGQGLAADSGRTGKAGHRPGGLTAGNGGQGTTGPGGQTDWDGGQWTTGPGGLTAGNGGQGTGADFGTDGGQGKGAAGDSAWVVVPLTQKVYAGNDYRAYVSGYEPRLDSLVMVGRREEVTVRERTTESGRGGGRLGVGFCAGVGIGLGGGVGPFVGVGVFWRIGR